MLRAIKSNETRLEYLGISARHVLLVGYVISALLGGVGGALVAMRSSRSRRRSSPIWTKSGEFVFIAILGGGGSALGAVRRCRDVRDSSASMRPPSSPTPGS